MNLLLPLILGALWWVSCLLVKVTVAEMPFNSVWLRNAIEEPLDEANIQLSFKLEG